MNEAKTTKINPDLIGWDPVYKVPFIYDIYTSNISFLQVAKDLKELGVENNKFFLKLYDQSLIGVNPYSAALSKDTIARIQNECIRNPWYFFREIARIPDEGGSLGPGSGRVFQLNRANLAAIYCFLNHIKFYLVIPRQTGKTQSVLAIIDYAYIFGTTNSSFSFVNKSQEDANKNLDRMKKQKAVLPLWLQQKYILVDGVVKEAKGTDNVKTLRNAANGNEIVCKPSAKTVPTAENIGRGNTSPIQYYDEVEWTANIGIIYAAAGPAYKSASDVAKVNNAAYCRMFTSTPGDLDSEPVKQFEPIRNQCARFTDKLYDLSPSELQEFVAKHSAIEMLEIEYSYKQLGKDEAWFKGMCQELGNDKIKIKRELLLQRIRGSSNSPFDPEDLDIINSMRKEPIKQVILNRTYALDIYRELNPHVCYFVGIDCATGSAGDNTAITVVNPYDLRPDAEFKSPYQGTTDMVKFIRELVKMIPRCILCIERNSIGSAIIELLKDTECYNNLYYDADKYIIGSPDERLDEKGFIEREAENRKCFGITTMTNTRGVMMAILARHVAEYKDRFVTINITTDLNNLVKNASGKILAASGAHDDCIMSYLIALFVYYHGNKLYRYGFVKGAPPVTEEQPDPVLDYNDIYNMMPESMKTHFEPVKPESPRGDPELMRAIMEHQQRMNSYMNEEGVSVKSNSFEYDPEDYESMMGDEDAYADLIGELNDL